MQKSNKPTEEDIIEFKKHIPLEIGKTYIVSGYRLWFSIKTRNILQIYAYPTREFREENLKLGLKTRTVHVEVYREALIKIGIFKAMENKWRKAVSSSPCRAVIYKLAKELLLEATIQANKKYLR
ncbi:hypothetical protein [Photobacterium iliopiscarium]|uniref:Uncharacterized protein n=1 Tax=Photobacterium iliopiscarium TaxID=56192 RepID=A0A2T3M5M3_9GAMM|nr:hypothetical protein [Photobacterium iliopiscarium]PSV87236.1 hypothetical protein C9I88_20290 [Photobacterium iliopiscarium]